METVFSQYLPAELSAESVNWMKVKAMIMKFKYIIFNPIMNDFEQNKNIDLF